MEEEKQSQFPIKTKIAIWWMEIIGMVGLVISGVLFIFCYGVYGFKSSAGAGDLCRFFAYLGFFCISLPLLVSETLISKRKKWAWKLAIIILITPILLILGLEMVTGGYFIEVFVINLPHNFFLFIPLILLLLDRKNFWKIAT